MDQVELSMLVDTGQPHYNAIFGVEEDRVISEPCYNEVVFYRHIAK